MKNVVEMEGNSTTEDKEDIEEENSHEVNEMPAEELERYLDINYPSNGESDNKSMQSIAAEK